MGVSYFWYHVLAILPLRLVVLIAVRVACLVEKVESFSIFVVAFSLQGYGWFTMEETSWGDSEHLWVKPGHLYTRGPGTYKIPSFNDVPSDMRVKLMDRANPFAVHSSKVRSL